MEGLRLAAYVDAQRERIVATLFDFLRIPSISAQPEHAPDVVRSAEFCADHMRACGLEHVTVLPTAGGPSVYGDHLHAGPGAPTITVYGHHDVQPVDPLHEWTSPPFEPVIVEGECRARGAVDDKGQVLMHLEAIRGLLERDGSLPVNVKFIVEGEEEFGSPHFESLLVAERKRLACDYVVVVDSDMWAPDVPSMCVAMRGLVAFDVDIRVGSIDLHSGLYGGAALNPAHLIARLVADLHDDEGRVTLPGFYDDVRELSATEADSLARLPFDTRAWMAEAGIRRLEGETGRSVLEQTTSRPTAEVVGIGVGYTDDGVKTIVAAHGGFKVTFRLVADQQPATVETQFRSWLAARVPEGVEATVTRFGGVSPVRTPVDLPGLAAVGRALERVWKAAPLYHRSGGSGPEEALVRVLEAPMLCMGICVPGDRIHAPNERMLMDQFWKGLLAAGELWHELAKEPS